MSYRVIREVSGVLLAWCYDPDIGSYWGRPDVAAERAQITTYTTRRAAEQRAKMNGGAVEEVQS
jgi:hypothetical protein